MVTRGDQIIRRSMKDWGRIETNFTSQERLLYERAKDPHSEIETAFVQLRNSYVPVWRPLTGEAEEWRPIYHVAMERDEDRRFVRPLRTVVNIRGADVELPGASLEIDRRLQEHIASVRKKTPQS